VVVKTYCHYFKLHSSWDMLACDTTLEIFKLKKKEKETQIGGCKRNNDFSHRKI
jgi:hypothetical protein